jgi:hypothetical protein
LYNIGEGAKNKNLLQLKMVVTRDAFSTGESGKRGEGVGGTKLPKLKVKFMCADKV